MSRGWRKGSTARWRRIRAQVLAENQRVNGGRCQLQLRGCTGQATQVHHTRGRAATGDNPHYLQAVCQHCNLKAGDPQQTDPQPRRVSRW